ncbi:MAG: hypothetical protein HY706_15460 [Candidatus Hydrogenedentes bacterium]|nr:hypothetical protein [Candidatus Hydrogenedentota bacterium]
MITYRCDGCGRTLAQDALRYTVKIDVRAAYDELEVHLADLVRDHRAEILALIERLKHKDPREIEETVYKAFKLDLCPACHRAYIRDPLRFHPEQGIPDTDLDIDAFLKSLGKSKYLGEDTTPSGE